MSTTNLSTTPTTCNEQIYDRYAIAGVSTDQLEQTFAAIRTIHATLPNIDVVARVAAAHALSHAVHQPVHQIHHVGHLVRTSPLHAGTHHALFHHWPLHHLVAHMRVHHSSHGPIHLGIHASHWVHHASVRHWHHAAHWLRHSSVRHHSHSSSHSHSTHRHMGIPHAR